MKRILALLFAVSLTLVGCMTKKDLANLSSRLESLEGQKINSIEGQISSINSSIDALQAAKAIIDEKIEALGQADGALAEQSDKLGQDIESLSAYVQELSSGTVPWAEATFATISQMSDLLTRLAAIELMAPTLKTTITDLETSIKAWVGVQLEGYSTIAAMNAAILVSETKLEGELSALNADLGGDINQLKADLNDAKSQLTSEYQAAIATAITTYAGTITAELSTKIGEVQTAIQGQLDDLMGRVTTLEGKISDLENRMAAVEEKIADALGRIQSVVVVPDNTDGSVDIKMHSNTTVRFEVSPVSAAKALVETSGAKDFFSFQAVEAQTKATTQADDVIDFTIESVAMDDNDEFVEVTVAPKPSISYDASFLARLKIEVFPGKGNYVCKTSYYFPYAVNIIDLSSKGTANCYIVPKSGTFKFRATVKGNSAESVGTPVSASVLWEANGRAIPTFTKVGDMIKTIELSDGYVIFDTPDILTDGNALIAVKDGSEKILWSWHIWICKGYDPEATAQVYNNNAGTFMDRNLGATSAEPGFLDNTNEKPSSGLLYQWGRKDPFHSSADAQQTATINQLILVASSSSKGTINYTVENPTHFISFADNMNHDWYYTGDASVDNTRWQSTKTKFDPCPNGWRVPDGSAWSTAFETNTEWKSASNWNATYLGMNFGSTIKKLGNYPVIWYPSAGKIGQTGRSEYKVSGSYWSVTPEADGTVLGLCIRSSGDVYPAMSLVRGYGCSVRCTAE